jgi:hypothetical protein
MHIHVTGKDGEAKFWIEPSIELANNLGLKENEINELMGIIKIRENEIREAWRKHF